MQATRRDEKINWRLILFLSGLGPLTGIVVLQVFIRGLLPGWAWVVVFLLVIPGSFAGWIAEKAAARYFFHGFMVGVLFTTLYLGTIISYFCFADDPPGLEGALGFMIFGAPLSGPVWSLFLGYSTWVAGKAVNQEWRGAAKHLPILIVIELILFELVLASGNWTKP